MTPAEPDPPATNDDEPSDQRERQRWIDEVFVGESGQLDRTTILLTPDTEIGEVFALLSDEEHDSIHVAGLLTVDEDFYNSTREWFDARGFARFDAPTAPIEWSPDAFVPEDEATAASDGGIDALINVLTGWHATEADDLRYIPQVVLQSGEGPTVAGVIAVLGIVRDIEQSAWWMRRFRRSSPVAPVHGMEAGQKFKPASPYTPVGPMAAPPQQAPTRAIDVLDTGLAPNSPWAGLGIVAADAASIDPVPDGAGMIVWPNGAHGTFCAGISRQAASSTLARVHRVVNAKGLVSERDVKLRLEALAANPPGRVDVVLMAFGGYKTQLPGAPGVWSNFNLLQSAVASFLAARPSAVIVAAAGNETSTAPSYPAAFSTSSDRVVSVGARTGGAASPLAAFTNYGTSVNAYARGVNLTSCFVTGINSSGQPFQGFASGSGTSFSSARVAGILANESAVAGSNVVQAWRKRKAAAGGAAVEFG